MSEFADKSLEFLKDFGKSAGAEVLDAGAAWAKDKMGLPTITPEGLPGAGATTAGERAPIVVDDPRNDLEGDSGAFEIGGFKVVPAALALGGGVLALVLLARLVRG